VPQFRELSLQSYVDPDGQEGSVENRTQAQGQRLRVAHRGNTESDLMIDCFIHLGNPKTAVLRCGTGIGRKTPSSAPEETAGSSKSGTSIPSGHPRNSRTPVRKFPGEPGCRSKTRTERPPVSPQVAALRTPH